VRVAIDKGRMFSARLDGNPVSFILVEIVYFEGRTPNGDVVGRKRKDAGKDVRNCPYKTTTS
jgi:hypothetical protein